MFVTGNDIELTFSRVDIVRSGKYRGAVDEFVTAAGRAGYEFLDPQFEPLKYNCQVDKPGSIILRKSSFLNLSYSQIVVLYNGACLIENAILTIGSNQTL